MLCCEALNVNVDVNYTIVVCNALVETSLSTVGSLVRNTSRPNTTNWPRRMIVDKVPSALRVPFFDVWQSCDRSTCGEGREEVKLCCSAISDQQGVGSGAGPEQVTAVLRFRFGVGSTFICQDACLRPKHRCQYVGIPVLPSHIDALRCDTYDALVTSRPILVNLFASTSATTPEDRMKQVIPILRIASSIYIGICESQGALVSRLLALALASALRARLHGPAFLIASGGH